MKLLEIYTIHLNPLENYVKWMMLTNSYTTWNILQINFMGSLVKVFRMTV